MWESNKLFVNVIVVFFVLMVYNIFLYLIFDLEIKFILVLMYGVFEFIFRYFVYYKKKLRMV